MIKVENTEVYGWEAAIRGMRNPMNSWEKSDSCYCKEPITTKCNNLGCSHCGWAWSDLGKNPFCIAKISQGRYRSSEVYANDYSEL